MSIIGATTGQTYTYENILSGQSVFIPIYTQYIVCFRLINEGVITINGALCIIL